MDKVINSKIYIFLEYIYKIIVLNFITLLVIIFGLGIFTLLPALVALIIVIKSLNDNYSFPLFKIFYKAFKANFKKMFVLQFGYYLIGSIFVFNTFYFYTAFLEWKSLIYGIGYFVSLFIDIIFIFVVINSCFIAVYFPNLNNRKIFKYSFSLLRVIPIQMLIIFFLIIVFLILNYLYWFIMIFFGVSLFILILNQLIKNTYEKLVADGVTSLDANYYL